jgi:hypothetical protein
MCVHTDYNELMRNLGRPDKDYIKEQGPSQMSMQQGRANRPDAVSMQQYQAYMKAYTEYYHEKYRFVCVCVCARVRMNTNANNTYTITHPHIQGRERGGNVAQSARGLRAQRPAQAA